MSGNSFLLDTNAIIALQRQQAQLLALLTTATDVFIPAIAIGELYFGAYNSSRVEDNRRAVAAFAAQRAILNIDAQTADVYGLIKQTLRVKGRPIPENDIWIAALAVQYNLTVITNDDHFAAVDGITALSW